MLELGSGTGYVGLKLVETLRMTKSNDLVILTDLPDVCPLLEDNLSIQSHDQYTASVDCECWVRPLPWGDNQYATQLAEELDSMRASPLSHIICSDLVS